MIKKKFINKRNLISWTLLNPFKHTVYDLNILKKIYLNLSHTLFCWGGCNYYKYFKVAFYLIERILWSLKQFSQIALSVQFWREKSFLWSLLSVKIMIRQCWLFNYSNFVKWLNFDHLKRHSFISSPNLEIFNLHDND